MKRALGVALWVAFCGSVAVPCVAIAQENVKPAVPTLVKDPSATGPVSVAILRSPDEIRTQSEVDRANRSLTERDLAAQVRAADAAERQITAAWVAAILSGIGTMLLAATLWDTRRTSRRQLRAYLDFDDTELEAVEASGDASDWWEARFRVKNFGETPAFGVTIDVRSHRPWRPDVVVIDDRKTPQPIGGITRGDAFTIGREGERTWGGSGRLQGHFRSPSADLGDMGRHRRTGSRSSRGQPRHDVRRCACEYAGGDDAVSFVPIHSLCGKRPTSTSGGAQRTSQVPISRQTDFMFDWSLVP